MPASTHQFRLFVSSTFSDLTAERDALLHRVFPRLRTLCREHNATFQAVDLRWGVSQGAAEDQSTMPICLAEIDRCRQATDEPNFIALLGERYGWRPLPDEIPDIDFSQIRNYLSGQNGDEAGLGLLDRWYRRDDNAVPATYRLVPRQGEYARFEYWQEVEQALAQSLRHSVQRLEFAPNRRRRYVASATELEIAHRGLLDSPTENEAVLCFIRTIDGLPHNRRAAEFLDVDAHGHPDEQAGALQTNLRTRLGQALGSNAVQYSTEWCVNGFPTGNIDALCQDVYTRLADIIQRDLTRIVTKDALESELDAHQRFVEERTRIFVGRSSSLERIAAYLSAPAPHPLVIYGEPGSGKSTLIAKALSRISVSGNPLFRFIGVVPGSSNVRTLLLSLCRQLRHRIGDPGTPLPTEFDNLVAEFAVQLRRATHDQPLTIFLDALDQLASTHGARNLSWMPTSLPEHVHVVVATLPGECLDALERRVPESHRHALAVMPPDEGASLLDLWLHEAGRTLRNAQHNAVVSAYTNSCLPLYLKLAFEEARLWHSDTPKINFPGDVPGIIRRLFQRLSSPAQHGSLIVSRALSYLAAGKNGLSWDEMLAVLSADRELIAPLWADPYSPVAEGDPLPAIFWSRLYYDLAPYLTERSVEGVTTLDFYHGQLREVVEEDYLVNEALTARHQSLARFFAREKLRAEVEHRQWAPTARELSEWPYQLACAELWHELEDALLDFDFQLARVTTAGPQSLIEDFDFVLETRRFAPMQAACGNIDHLCVVRDALRAASPVVETHPVQLASQLCGRLLSSTNANIQRLMSNVSRWQTSPWLRPLRASLASGALRFTLRGHKGTVRSLALTPDARCCATAGNSSPDKTVRLWDLDRGRLLHVLEDQAEEGGYTPLAFSTDADFLIHGADNELVVNSVATGIEQHRLIGHKTFVHAVAVAARAHRGISADDSGELRVWNLQTWALERCLHLSSGGKAQLAITCDGTRAVALSASDVSVFDVDSGRVIAELKQDMGSVEWWCLPPLAISEDGLSVYFGHQLRCWKLPDGPVDTLLRQGESIMDDAAVRAVLCVDPIAGRVLVSPLTDTIRDRYLPSDTYDTLEVWDLANHESITTLHPQGSDVVVAALGTEGDRVIVAHLDHSVRVWDVGQPESGVVRDHDNRVSSAHVLDGVSAITRDQGNQDRFWNMSTGIKIDDNSEGYPELLREAQTWFESRIPDPEEQSQQTSDGLVIVGLPNRRLWVYAEHSPVAIQFEASNGKFGEEIDPADKPDDNTRIPMDVWELDAQGKQVHLRHPAATSASPLNEVRVSADGRLAVSAAWGSLRVWDLETGRQRYRLDGHTAPVWGVAMADHDRKAISVSEDATVRVWNVEKGSLVATFTCESPLHAIDAVVIHERGKDVLSVIAGEDSGRVHILHLEAEQEV